MVLGLTRLDLIDFSIRLLIFHDLLDSIANNFNFWWGYMSPDDGTKIKMGKLQLHLQYNSEIKPLPP